MISPRRLVVYRNSVSLQAILNRKRSESCVQTDLCLMCMIDTGIQASTDMTDKVILVKTITIHHERPCRTEISHLRGRKFNQGRGLPSPWLNSDPEGEISLSYMDRLMMDRFSPTFGRVFVRT